MTPPPRALTLDLDDTLWPNREVILRAEAAFHAWLQAHAPATAAQFPPARMRALRQALSQRHPELVHDLTAMRLLTTRAALAEAGEDPALAGPAFEVFVAERQRVVPYDDVAEGLDRLARRYPLLALTNGNADLERIGLAGHFVGSVTARSAGIAKPHARIFLAGCARLGLAPAQVMHVGDNWELDVLGARQAGLHSAWVVRPDAAPPHGLEEGAAARPHGLEEEGGPAAAAARPPGAHLTVADLVELADALGA